MNVFNGTGIPIKKDGLLRQPITCYEIAKMTYVGNSTINMPLVMLFLVGNKMVYINSKLSILFKR